MGLRIVRISAPPSMSGEGEPVPAPAASPAIDPASQSQPRRTQGDLNVPSLTGSLGPGLGTKLLMHLFLEERSGRLSVDAAGLKATLFFFAGEPVHSEITDGGAAIEKRLTERGPLRHAQPGRHPLATLARRSNPVAVLDALREEVRDHARRLFTTPAGDWLFFDDESFLDWTPLTGVNPFGLALEARRRAMQPQDVLGLGEQLAPLYPAPRVDFPNVSARLKSFTGGVDLADVLDGRTTSADVFRAVNMDPIMGGLVLQTLADTALVQLLSGPKQQTEKDRRRQAKPTANPSLVQADAKHLAQLSATPHSGGEILAMYLELKPERDENAIFGVEGSAGLAALERGYQQRLAELDPRAIPASPARPYLLARAEELRTKIERVYQTRMASRPKAKTSAAYQILDRLGAGGMAEVFRGIPTDNPTSFVAIKVILPELRKDPKFSQLFLDEARLARRIQHPNVVRVLTVGRGSDDLYLAMEYVDGMDFNDLLRRGRDMGSPASVDMVCRIVADASAGLHAAHTARDRSGAVTPILHRDVSPQNILVSRTGEVKLSDFGIAKAMDTQDEEAGVVKGKIPYLAPEMLQGKGASVRTDVYAMAMTVYASLGRLPFQRGDRVETMRAILYEPLPPLSTLAPGIPRILDSLLLTAAAKNPDERHASAQQLQLELEEILALRPPVDIAGWVRPLAGKRAEPGAPSRPITSILSSTGLTGVSSLASGTPTAGAQTSTLPSPAPLALPTPAGGASGANRPAPATPAPAPPAHDTEDVDLGDF